MSDYTSKIKEISERLLKEEKVEIIIGFRKGTVPMMNEPCFVKTPEDVKELVWDSNCGINLANYLTGRKEKIAIIAKGCDSRNIVTHIIENKIKREQLIIIGVPCKGMIDKNKITSMFENEIRDVSEDEKNIIVKGEGFEKTLNKNDVLQENCKICVHRNPVIYDELAADLIDEQKVDRYEDVRKIEAMSPEEKWSYFDDLLSPCIRCYACRNACPLCYCPTCFVDESMPQWVGKSIDPVDTRTFHLL
ncbi:MAG: 4Fe-4S ferredoxin, partial [Proteobacteria bacterium]|nr:4Fe-4S ferredoxin [Pseudomonadota bacterium]